MGDLGEWKRHPRVQQSDDFDLTLKFTNIKANIILESSITGIYLPPNPSPISIFSIPDGSGDTFPGSSIGTAPIAFQPGISNNSNSMEMPHETYEKNTLPTLVARYADEFPQKTAIEYENQSVSYAELDQRANQLAHYLLKGKLNAKALLVFSWIAFQR